MRKAIITGASGLVGMAVARYFTSCGIETLCLGRREISPEDACENFGPSSRYLSLSMKNLPRLAEKIDLINWSPGPECVFFNFAWSGLSKLTDGELSDQINNVIYASEAVRIAKKLGCIKFVNAGTLEETVVERFLEDSNNYQSSQPNYAFAKLAARDMCTVIAYLEKIDYVHTRMSVPLSFDLSRGTYVAETLRKICKGVPYEEPSSKQKFDIIFLEDVAKAYYLIGMKGKNKANYFIGSSQPATLAQYFTIVDNVLNNRIFEVRNHDEVADNIIFNTDDIRQDTGFIASMQLKDLFKKTR